MKCSRTASIPAKADEPSKKSLLGFLWQWLGDRCAGGSDADGTESAGALAQGTFQTLARAADDMAAVFSDDPPELSSLLLTWALQVSRRHNPSCSPGHVARSASQELCWGYTPCAAFTQWEPSLLCTQLFHASGKDAWAEAAAGGLLLCCASPHAPSVVALGGREGSAASCRRRSGARC